MQTLICGDNALAIPCYRSSDVTITASGPETRLIDLEQQLEVAESRCGSLKSQLDYMKMLYQGIQPDSTDWIKPLFRSKESTNNREHSLLSTPIRSPRDPETNDDNATAEDEKYQQFLDNLHKLQQSTIKDDGKEPSPLILNLHESESSLNKTFPQQTSISPNAIPLLEQAKGAVNDEYDAVSKEYRYIKHNKSRSNACTLFNTLPVNSSIPSPITSCAITPRVIKICKEHDIDDSTAGQYPFEQHFVNYSAQLEQDLMTAGRLATNFSIENASKYCDNTRSEEINELKRQDLALKFADSIDNTPIIKRRKLVRVDRKQKTWPYTNSVVKTPNAGKFEDNTSIASKIKRRKVKLKNIRTKNTAVTKDINPTDKKYTGKQKQRSFRLTPVPAARQAEVSASNVQRRRSEVVEIYHNDTVEGESRSTSITSSKHSHESHSQKNNPTCNKDDEVQEATSMTYQQQEQWHYPSRQREKRQYRSQQHRNKDIYESVTEKQDFTDFPSSNIDAYSQNVSESIDQEGENCAVETQNFQMQQCYSPPPCQSHYCDPSLTRNYEQPTMASKMKRVNRSYFTRFNLKNIPFVVGTSVSPSHNLGLNIQQVLSIMKTKQPMSTGNTPLIIRKLGKPVKPEWKFQDQRKESEHCTGQSWRNPTLSVRGDDRLDGTQNSSDYTDLLVHNIASKYKARVPLSLEKLYDDHLDSNEKSQTQFADEKEVIALATERDQQRENACSCCLKKDASYNRTLRQYTSRKNFSGNSDLPSNTQPKPRREDIENNDYNKVENTSYSSKGIRQVLMDLYNQFEHLNTTYEALCKQVEETNDKSLAEEITALERELNMKEEEINAFIGLYKEVLSLKQQVRNIQEKKNFICIDARSPVNTRPMTQTRGLSQTFKNPRHGPTSTTYETSTSTRLTSLLRQIQSYQKQLLLS